MAMVKSTLVADLLAIFRDMKNVTDESSADQIFASKMADVIDGYIRSADVAAGIPVSTEGSPTAQTGVTTGVGHLV